MKLYEKKFYETRINYNILLIQHNYGNVNGLINYNILTPRRSIYNKTRYNNKCEKKHIILI